jgi:hypothetical protein
MRQNNRPDVEAVNTSETSVSFNDTTQRKSQKTVSHLYTRRRENLKSLMKKEITWNILTQDNIKSDLKRKMCEATRESEISYEGKRSLAVVPWHRIILNRILKEKGARVWNRFNWLWIAASEGLTRPNSGYLFLQDTESTHIHTPDAIRTHWGS